MFILRLPLGFNRCARVIRGTGGSTTCCFNHCQKHMIYGVQWRVCCFAILCPRDGGTGLTFSHHSISLWGTELFPEAPPPSVFGRWNSLLYFHGELCLDVACHEYSQISVQKVSQKAKQYLICPFHARPQWAEKDITVKFPGRDAIVLFRNPFSAIISFFRQICNAADVEC